MKTILALSRSDFYSTFRDPVFRGLLFFPLMAFALVRWIYPLIVTEYPPLEPYSQVILMWACLQTATMFGFLYGFLMLEEKEERVWQVIRILPVSGFTLIFSRLLLGLLISVLVNFLLLHYGRILDVGLLEELMLAFLYSLAAPIIALFIAAFSANRIEGLAQMKILNLLLVIPALIYFFPYKALHVFALLPTYWSFRALEYAGAGIEFVLFFTSGVAFHLAVILLLIRKLSRLVPD